jgi:acetate kinase
MGNILVVNAGSSSIKFSLFELGTDPKVLVNGKVEEIGTKSVFSAEKEKAELPEIKTHKDAMQHILNWLNKRGQGKLAAAAHRVLHGGEVFCAPVVITPDAIEKMKTLIPLGPLHQPHNIVAIEILASLMPDLPQVACFDTAFHSVREPLFSHYAVPDALTEKGLKSYGFHGLSYEWIARVLEKDHPALFKGKVVVAHLGNGSSLCAIKNGKCVDTTMGLTPLQGLPMGTRCGNIDAGAVFFMQRTLGMTLDQVEKTLWKESGLKGMSGISSDVRTLEESKDPKAKFALEYFVTRAAQLIAYMATAVGGMDALIFTGGIGENGKDIRAAILERLAFIGKINMIVIPANEERVMALHAIETLKLA